MGLFDKIMGDDSTDQDSVKEEIKDEFKSIVVESENVPREIKSVAAANKIPVNELDFKIIKIKTMCSLGADEGWIEADDEQLNKFEDRLFLLNQDLKVKQTYKVNIFKKENEENENILPVITLGGNKLLTKVIATIKSNENVKYFSKIESSIIEEINKKKIKVGVLVGLFDENTITEVKKLVSELRVNGTQNQDKMFIVSQGIDPVAPTNDNFIYHYKKEPSKINELERIDYTKRGYVLATAKGDCMMEYIKPQEGTPGRNTQGKYISINEPKCENELIITITENIIKKEDDTKIRYLSDKNGYINESSPGVYDIQDEMDINDVSFKSTGSIQTEMSAEVKINIKESDSIKDAIGPGMRIETFELTVDGNVGSGAKIKSENLVIGGQTHKTSTLEAKNAKIAVHRGELIGSTIEIDRLEGGKVIGDVVTVKQAIGGEIIAKEITIDVLHSNVQITASEKIDIKNLTGNNNKLLIDPTVTKEFLEQTKKTNEEIKELKKKIKFMPRNLDDRKKLIGKTKPTIDMVKNKILELKKDGKTVPFSLRSKIKEFQNLVNEYNELLGEYKKDKHSVLELREDLDNIQNKIFEAKIINHSPWKEYNEIRFKLISPAIEKTYTTKEHEIIREFFLKKVDEDSYEIQKSSEYTS